MSPLDLSHDLRITRTNLARATYGRSPGSCVGTIGNCSCGWRLIVAPPKGGSKLAAAAHEDHVAQSALRSTQVRYQSVAAEERNRMGADMVCGVKGCAQAWTGHATLTRNDTYQAFMVVCLDHGRSIATFPENWSWVNVLVPVGDGQMYLERMR